MKTLPLFVCCLLGTTALAAPPAKPAPVPASTVPDPNAWTQRVYRFPSYELIHGFVTRERGQIHAPPLPTADASAEQVEKFLKLSHDVASQYLASELGIPLVKGSLAAFDPVSKTLAVRAPNSTQDIIASYAMLLVQRSPEYLSFNTHLVEADGAVLRAMMKETTTGAEHRALWERIQALVEQGKAKDVGTLRVDTRSGQRVKIERGEQRRHGTGFTLGEQGWFEVPQTGQVVGTSLELDPVIGPDGRTVDVSFSLQHDFAPPVERWTDATRGGPQRIESQVTDFHSARVTTAITVLSGMTHLMGIWKPDGAPEPERAGNLQAAFLTCNVVPLLPLENDRVAKLLKDHGEKVVPTPPPGTKIQNEVLPSGMVVRRFRVPPDFLTTSPEARADRVASADPFAAGGAAPRNEPHAMRSVTAADVLKLSGIPFPEGASANFSSATSELVVRNLPENQEKIAAYVDSLLKHVPASIVCSVHVVQADAKTLRDLSAQTSQLADHAAAWKVIEDAAAQGKAKILTSAWLESRSGQRANTVSGTQYMTVASPELLENRRVKGNGNANAVLPPADNKNAAPPNAAPGGLTAEHEMTPVGFTMEVDPVIGPDGETIDLSMAITYDYAPPLPRPEGEPAAEKRLRVSAPATDFHKASFSTAMTLTSGMTRLLGVWKPEGTAEFQNGDVLQAAFLKADVVPVEEAGK